MTGQWLLRCPGSDEVSPLIDKGAERYLQRTPPVITAIVGRDMMVQMTPSALVVRSQVLQSLDQRMVSLKTRTSYDCAQNARVGILNSLRSPKDSFRTHGRHRF